MLSIQFAYIALVAVSSTLSLAFRPCDPINPSTLNGRRSISMKYTKGTYGQHNTPNEYTGYVFNYKDRSVYTYYYFNQNPRLLSFTITPGSSSLDFKVALNDNTVYYYHVNSNMECGLNFKGRDIYDVMIYQ